MNLVAHQRRLFVVVDNSLSATTIVVADKFRVVALPLEQKWNRKWVLLLILCTYQQRLKCRCKYWLISND
jgi:hypothetical protein